MSNYKIQKEGLNIVFSLVVGFLILIIIQSVKSNISKCPVFKTHGNICLDQMDFINKHCFSNLFKQPIITFLFVIGLNFLMTYFIFELFSDCLPDLKNMNNINNMKMNMKMNKCKRDNIINLDCDDTMMMSGCPFGFGKKKRVDRGCNFMNECMKPEKVEVKVASNLDINECGEKEQNIIKDVLDGILPGLFPKVIDAMKNKSSNCENENTKENTKETQNTKENTKETKNTKEPVNNKDDIKQLGGKITDLMGDIKSLLNNKDLINVEGFNLGELIG